MSTFSDWLFETAKAQVEAYRLSENPEPIDLSESMETVSNNERDVKKSGMGTDQRTNPSPAHTLWGGGGENTKSVREAPSPSQFPFPVVPALAESRGGKSPPKGSIGDNLGEARESDSCLDSSQDSRGDRETLFSTESDRLFEHRPYCCDNCEEIDARQAEEGT